MRKTILTMCLLAVTLAAKAEPTRFNYNYSLFSNISNSFVGRGGSVGFSTNDPESVLHGDVFISGARYSNGNRGSFNGYLGEGFIFDNFSLHLHDGMPVSLDARGLSIYEYSFDPRIVGGFYIESLNMDSYNIGRNNTFSYGYQLQTPTASRSFSDRGIVVFANAVPEPETYALLLVGLAGIWAVAKRKAASTAVRR